MQASYLAKKTLDTIPAIFAFLMTNLFISNHPHSTSLEDIADFIMPVSFSYLPI